MIANEASPKPLSGSGVDSTLLKIGERVFLTN